MTYPKKSKPGQEWSGNKVPKMGRDLSGLADCGEIFVSTLGMTGEFLEDFEQGSDRLCLFLKDYFGDSARNWS